MKVHWVVGFKQKQWLPENNFQNIIQFKKYKWTKYALCESTLSGEIQLEAMPRRRSFLKDYTHSNIQLKKVCSLWKYNEWWASGRSNGFQKKFFKTLYIFKHKLEQSMASVKVHCLVGFKQKQCLSDEVFWNIIHIQAYTWTKYAFCESTLSGGLQAQAMVSEEVFPNIIHMQTYNWTKYALCGSTLIGWLQAEAMASRRKFSKHNTFSKIQVNKICTLWKYTEWWDSIRSNASQKKSFETIYTFKNTIEQRMRSVKVHWLVGFKQKHWLSEEFFPHIIHIQTYKLTKYTEWWASGRSNGLQRKFFKTIYTFKHTIEQSMRSVKVHCVVGFEQKQCIWEEVFWSIIHIQTYTWTKCAFCECTLIGGLQAEAMVSAEVFQNIIHIQTYIWTMYALRESTLSGWLQAEALAFRRIFPHITHIQAHNWTMYALCERSLSVGIQADAMGFRRSFSKHYT